MFAELGAATPRRHFTIGIHDDVTHLSLKWDAEFSTEPPEVKRAVFYGLGSDGTVGANKNSVKIIGENTPLYAQGYFVYDSKKAGSVTVSHLRFSKRPIRSTYLISRADFVACHQFHLLERMDMLSVAEPGATFLLNSPFGPDEVWDQLPQEVQEQILDEAAQVLRGRCEQSGPRHGAGHAASTRSCRPASSRWPACCRARRRSRRSRTRSRSRTRKRGEAVLQRNYAAVDAALEGHASKSRSRQRDQRRIGGSPPVPLAAPDFVQRVTARIIAGQGDLLPVSALPVDGTFATGTAKYEKRSIANEIPIWDSRICIECGLCALVCPHAAIRTKSYAPDAGAIAPEGFRSANWPAARWPAIGSRIQVAPDDCTGCGVCVDVCPAKSKEAVKHKAINMEPKVDHLDRERINFEHFLTLPEFDRTRVKTRYRQRDRSCCSRCLNSPARVRAAAKRPT